MYDDTALRAGSLLGESRPPRATAPWRGPASLSRVDANALSALDVAALGILGVALLRGLWIGLIREAFSLGALVAACIAVRVGLDSATAFVHGLAPEVLDPTAARVAAGAGLAIAAIAAVGITGRFLRRGAQAVGLGAVDRLLGGVLGGAEGAVVVAVVFLGLGTVLGRDHPEVASSRVFAAFERVERVARGEAPLPDVAAPPPASERS